MDLFSLAHSRPRRDGYLGNRRECHSKTQGGQPVKTCQRLAQGCPGKDISSPNGERSAQNRNLRWGEESIA